MRYLVALLAIFAAAASSAQPQQDPRGLRVVGFLPVALPDAVAEFERICIASNFEVGAFERQIAAAQWRFREEAGFGTPRPKIQRAPQALVMFHGSPAQESRSFAPGQCNMNFVLPAPASKDEVLRAVGAAVARAAPVQPGWRESRGETCLRWTATGEVRRVCLIGSDKAVQHVALSFQLWTPAGEARAGLTPAN